MSGSAPLTCVSFQISSTMNLTNIPYKLLPEMYLLVKRHRYDRNTLIWSFWPIILWDLPIGLYKFIVGIVISALRYLSIHVEQELQVIWPPRKHEFSIHGIVRRRIKPIYVITNHSRWYWNESFASEKNPIHMQAVLSLAISTQAKCYKYQLEKFKSFVLIAWQKAEAHIFYQIKTT